MGVYLPTGAVGNGRVLCTLGRTGEIMSFFYPNIDFAQNVRQLLSALYVGDPGHGRFLWTFDAEFTVHQAYEAPARVLTTRLGLASEGLRVSFTDFCPPGEAALVRRVRIESERETVFRGTFMQYFELRLHEVTGKQSVTYLASEGVTVQYFRDIAIAVGGRRPDVWRCGKSIDDGPRSAKSDLYDGHLCGQPEDIGQVDFALGWFVEVQPGEAVEFDVILAADNERRGAVESARALGLKGGAKLEAVTVAEDTGWLAGCLRPSGLPEDLAEAYDRALLSLRMLQDSETAAFIAAPEFDPSYELCGGYGYCWPRDATEAAEALLLAGHREPLARLCSFYEKTQLPSGQWGQRYWSNAKMASSWSLREDFLQVDQTAAALIALCKEAAQGASPGRWEIVRRGADALAGMVGEDGWHAYACDLWETFCGTFVYTNAAIFAALHSAATVADLAGDDTRARRWRETAAGMKQAVIGLHNGSYFPRGVAYADQPDWVVDSSTLGVSEPFRMLDVMSPKERGLVETNLGMIEARLRHTLPDGGTGVRRYEGDGYLEGVIGCVNTLWAALVSLQVAVAYAEENPQRAGELRASALDYIRFCLAHGTVTGLLPELIGTTAEYPYWAAPHSWASGLLVKCVLTLAELDRALGV